MTTIPTSSSTLLAYPSIDSYISPRYSYIESLSHKLGCVSRRSANYLRSKQGKRRALQTYIITEALISVLSIVSMLLAKIYLPAILLSLMLAYLIYAALGAF